MVYFRNSKYLACIYFEYKNNKGDWKNGYCRKSIAKNEWTRKVGERETQKKENVISQKELREQNEENELQRGLGDLELEILKLKGRLKVLEIEERLIKIKGSR